MRGPVAVVYSIVLAGCLFQDKPAPPAVFPDAPGVSKLVVASDVQISDSAAIEQFLGALSPLKSGWRYTWHTYPTPQAVVFLVGPGETTLCRVFLGPNWLGSDCGQPKSAEPWPPYIHLSSAQARWFRDRVGGKWEVQ